MLHVLYLIFISALKGFYLKWWRVSETCGPLLCVFTWCHLLIHALFFSWKSVLTRRKDNDSGFQWTCNLRFSMPALFHVLSKIPRTYNGYLYNLSGDIIRQLHPHTDLSNLQSANEFHTLFNPPKLCRYNTLILRNGVPETHLLSQFTALTHVVPTYL